MPLRTSPMKTIWWFFRRPCLQGTSCIIAHGDELLMIDYKYGSGWNFPTGIIRMKEESAEESAIRELREELSIKVQQLRYIGYVFCRFQFRRDRVFCFVADVPTKNAISLNKDIRRIEWIHKSQLDSVRISPFSREIIARWFKKQPAAAHINTPIASRQQSVSALG